MVLPHRCSGGPSSVEFLLLLSTNALLARGDGLLSYSDSFPPQRQYLDQLRASLPKEEMIAQLAEAEPGLGICLSVCLSVLLAQSWGSGGSPLLCCARSSEQLSRAGRHFFLYQAAASLG